MSELVRQLLKDVSGSDLKLARDAGLCSIMMLQFDTNQSWDSSEIQLLTRLEVGHDQPGDLVFIELIQGLGACLEKPGLNDEIRRSILSALTKSNRHEVIPVFLELLRSEDQFADLCENTDVLMTLVEFVQEGNLPARYASDLAGIVKRLEGLEFSDFGAEHARKGLVKWARG